MYFNSNEPLIDVACQRLGSNPYSECPLYGRRAAYICMQNVNILYIVHSKGQTRPLVREGAPHQQNRNCLTVIKIWSYAPDGCLTPRQTGRLTVGRNITHSLTHSQENKWEKKEDKRIRRIIRELESSIERQTEQWIVNCITVLMNKSIQ
jgi:hypothetical protein